MTLKLVNTRSTKDQSTCAVSFGYSNNALVSALVRFSGPLSGLPSVSNNRKIIMLKTGRPMSIKDPVHQWHFDEMHRLYVGELEKLSLFPPSFGSCPVHLEVVLSDLNKRKDCHNVIKGLCDWIEKAALVDNDRFIKSVKVQFGCNSAVAYRPNDTTSISLCPVERVQRFSDDLTRLTLPATNLNAA